jgi:hypothetical protein
MYIIGYEGEKLITLDPHTTQDIVCNSEDIDSYSTDQTTVLVNISEMDPTITLTFLV